MFSRLKSTADRQRNSTGSPITRFFIVEAERYLMADYSQKSVKLLKRKRGLIMQLQIMARSAGRYENER